VFEGSEKVQKRIPAFKITPVMNRGEKRKKGKSTGQDEESFLKGDDSKKADQRRKERSPQKRTLLKKTKKKEAGRKRGSCRRGSERNSEEKKNVHVASRINRGDQKWGDCVGSFKKPERRKC